MIVIVKFLVFIKKDFLTLKKCNCVQIINLASSYLCLFILISLKLTKLQQLTIIWLLILPAPVDNDDGQNYACTWASFLHQFSGKFKQHLLGFNSDPFKNISINIAFYDTHSETKDIRMLMFRYGKVALF